MEISDKILSARRLIKNIITIGAKQLTRIWFPQPVQQFSYLAVCSLFPVFTAANYTNSHIKQIHHIIISYTTNIKNKQGYSLSITTTYINDTNYLDKYAAKKAPNSIVTSQVMIFKRNGKLIRSKLFENEPFNGKNNKDSNGRKANALSDVIYAIGFVEGQKYSFYEVLGYGGCTLCPQSVNFYDLNGKLLNKLYFTGQEDSSKKIGSISETLKKYKVSLSKRTHVNIIFVFPPNKNGQLSDVPAG